MGWFNSSSSHSRPSYTRASSTFSSHSRSGSSYYKRRPRDNYIQMLLRKFKHLIRELYYYARRHPIKILFMVIMPLISGGVLHQIARQFGIQLPAALRGNGGARGFRDDNGYYSSQGYEGRSDGVFGGFGDFGSVVKVARMFM
ncbi:hypothetical protein EJ05DRAFT_480970 [Pseudovirgaria hyperparasitica]|uniref:Uncharacterized protein n=1 Tax=Pseudovirgaria hyperparasitica TaxID=470096 RepID=A0A6A6VTA2_9PEZI|nr:uncharacterized protein EJ05DRAFT_480970 [Pseudovirgaria hyperparasitica]KAF2752820.1 hypothetical protein EJ05DRAFT_480970 [Pseudovirgaria hyperparasitica]